MSERKNEPEFRRVRSAPTPPGSRGGTPPARDPLPLPDPTVRRKRWALLFAGSMSVVVLLASGTAWAITGWMSGQLNRFDVFGGLVDRPDAGPKGALDFLVIGSDSREGVSPEDQSGLGVGHIGGERSDTMMLVHLNNDRDEITVVGIPRDSWVDIPGHGENKINAAYAFGGPQLTVQTVETLTRVRIDHYVEVDFTGFVDVVDALDGIEVCLPEPIDDPKAQLDMDAGTHQVDGAEALAFARTRKTAGGDLDRIDRQQQVLSALLDKALGSDTLSDPRRLSAFLDHALGSVTVDEGLDTRTINQLANRLSDIGLDDVSFTQVPLDDTAYWTPRGDVAVTWNRRAADRLFAQIAADKPITDPEQAAGRGETADPGDAPGDLRPGDIRVQIFNGTGTPGQGNRARAEFTGAGFQVPAAAQDWSSADVPTTLVRHAPQRKRAAELVADAVPDARLQEDSTLGAEVQVVVGFTYTGLDAPQGAAAAEPTPEPSAGERSRVRTSTARDNVCGD
ncbi:LCP family protein required for cell wall assembly [Nocardiopsis mwathae]|uniref:LCP family protein required for cell wall assembly n=1 Tax=Nocardiopsis mwathae TaxID=1472723 RepID=A0A7X0D3H4_9ACTN|nr:LCP family protein [Nocardiopsis mwathae]MBB6170075.1 LCP family protein required for cell wall assembly [Nocardiopsis mwathae]